MTLQAGRALSDYGKNVRLQLTVRGAVQGVGFRPFIYRLAEEIGLCGWVRNSAAGVVIEVEGAATGVHSFCARLATESPPRSMIQGITTRAAQPDGCVTFEILASESAGNPRTLSLPDLATCAECLSEINDPGNRRYRYPFTNCTHCGPRYSILEKLPYDRENTSMRHFTMCAACRAEYSDPSDRRFHAQPNACPACGPTLQLWSATGDVLAEAHDALLGAAAALRQGAIVALKGIGGFHLLAAAANPAAVDQLRKRKQRPEKPLAVMFPTEPAINAACEVSPLQSKLLQSPQAPIVLLRKKNGAPSIAANVAPDNPWLGALLPYSPLHHLLLSELDFAVVATSGNLSHEPICIDQNEALARLGRIADLLLVHDRPILRPLDDSVVRVMAGREMMLRRARGFAPLPITSPGAREPALALGAHLKNSIALAVGEDCFISQHIGDLDSPAARDVLRNVATDLKRLYGARAGTVVTEQHPDAFSHQLAHEFDAPVTTIQHHHAHIRSCMAEQQLGPPVLGVAWDGTGYGTDGAIWGGEFLRITEAGFERVAHLRTFPLPGGDRAAREPRRSALGILYELFGDNLFHRHADLLAAFTSAELKVLRPMLKRKVNCPRTSSAGRLFDAAASLLGLRQHASFEGQAAMELEFAADGCASEDSYHCPLGADGVIDWKPALQALMADRLAKRPTPEIAASFHHAMAGAIVATAQRIGEPRVVLSGGCFQNQYLTERVINRLQQTGFAAHWHQHVPPNDGGIALGQLAAAQAFAPTTNNA